MTAQPAAAPVADLASVCGDVLTPALRAHHGRRPTSLDVVPLALASTHPVYRLLLTLDDGSTLTLVAKHARPLDGRAREALVYERLLADRGFGAPLLYAATPDPVSGGTWLLLEDVGGHRLDWCGMRAWTAGLRTLAGLHGAHDGRQDELRSLGCLVDHDAEFYRAVAQSAAASLAEHGTTTAYARLSSLCDRWLDPVVAELTEQPRTLVHGCMYAQHMHLQPGTRIRIVDWETAALGLPAWDLTRLLAGWGTLKPDLLAVYAAELARQTGRPPDTRRLDRMLAHCDVLRHLRTLAWWKDPCTDPAHVTDLLDRIERSWGRLGVRHG